MQESKQASLEEQQAMLEYQQAMREREHAAELEVVKAKADFSGATRMQLEQMKSEVKLVTDRMKIEAQKATKAAELSVQKMIKAAELEMEGKKLRSGNGKSERTGSSSKPNRGRDSGRGKNS